MRAVDLLLGIGVGVLEVVHESSQARVNVWSVTCNALIAVVTASLFEFVEQHFTIYKLVASFQAHAQLLVVSLLSGR
jgi:hypothetical protein